MYSSVPDYEYIEITKAEMYELYENPKGHFYGQYRSFDDALESIKEARQIEEKYNQRKGKCYIFKIVNH